MFGMGTGVTLPTKSPENRIIFHFSFQICHLPLPEHDSASHHHKHQGLHPKLENRKLRKNFFGSGDPAGVLKSRKARGTSRARVRATELLRSQI